MHRCHLTSLCATRDHGMTLRQSRGISRQRLKCNPAPRKHCLPINVKRVIRVSRFRFIRETATIPGWGLVAGPSSVAERRAAGMPWARREWHHDPCAGGVAGDLDDRLLAYLKGPTGSSE